MNPSSNEAPNLTLPSPVEQGPVQPEGGEQVVRALEQAPAARPERTPTAGTQVIPTIPAVPFPDATNAQQTTIQSSVSPITDDKGDVIEKEWVVRAKQIVERTRNDPFQQSEQLTIFKADYMKQRYNKIIKVK